MTNDKKLRSSDIAVLLLLVLILANIVTVVMTCVAIGKVNAVLRSNAEAAQEAGNKKLEEINAKLAETGKPAAKAAQSGFKCERCGKVIKPIKFGDGTLLKVSDILETSKKDMGGNYCYKCYMELMEARDGGGH